jgi:hypothetical protein
MMFAIKAEVSDSRAETFAFSAQKTMYGGKHIAKGDMIFVFASENEGGPGLVASGVVTSAKAIPKKHGIAPANAAREHHHQTHRARKAAPGAEASSELSPTGTTVDPRPSSISNSIVRQRTRLSASRMKRRRSSAGSFNERISNSPDHFEQLQTTNKKRSEPDLHY